MALLEPMLARGGSRDVARDGVGVAAAKEIAGDSGGGLPCFGDVPEGLQAMDDDVDTLHALAVGEGDGAAGPGWRGRGYRFCRGRRGPDPTG